jgi:ribosomal protein L40E
MSDFIDGGYGSQTTEIYLKRVLAGNIESVRARLGVAVERLGYDLLEEEPALHARRAARGWGVWQSSADVLDYPMTLVVRLKSAGENATHATFDYTIKHPWLSKGEKEVLTREAEAIVALATARATEKVCTVCGTEATDDSRFCRRCGAPMTSEQAELDVLRMAAETRAGHTSVVTSTILSLASIAVALIAWLVFIKKGTASTKGLWLVIAMMGALTLFNLLVGRFAWQRLNAALASRREETRTLPGARPQTLPHVEPAALPPRQAVHSVTEGTTELLNAQQPREPEPLPLRRGRDTSSVN